jgi:hypothetical protein
LINPVVSVGSINGLKRGGLYPHVSSAVNTYSSTEVDTAPAGSQFGSLMLHSIAQSGHGINLAITNDESGGTDFVHTLGSMLGIDRGRVIGVAIEIHNTTAEIYKQGSVTIAQLPDCACDSSNVCNRDTTGVWSTSFSQIDRSCKIAKYVDSLRTVPGSLTWAAAEGCYVVPRMTMVPRDIHILTYANTGVLEGTGGNTRLPILYVDGGSSDNWMPAPVGLRTDSSNKIPLFLPTAPAGFSPVQIYFTGLSPETSLTVTFKTIVEYFPAIGSSLLPLAMPSPSFDPKALALYSKIASIAPFAVPVDENEAGEYFRKIMVALSKAAVLIAPMFGQYSPLVSAIGSVGQRVLSKGPNKTGPRAVKKMIKK